MSVGIYNTEEKYAEVILRTCSDLPKHETVVRYTEREFSDYLRQYKYHEFCDFEMVYGSQNARDQLIEKHGAESHEVKAWVSVFGDTLAKREKIVAEERRLFELRLAVQQLLKFHKEKFWRQPSVTQKLDLRDCKLASINLSGIELADIDFSGGSMALARLGGSVMGDDNKISRCNFDGCDLEGSSFENARLSDVSMQKADLTWAYLGFGEVVNVNMRGAIFDRAFISLSERSKWQNVMYAGAEFGDGTRCRWHNMSNLPWHFQMSAQIGNTGLISNKAQKARASARRDKRSEFVDRHIGLWQ